MGGIRHPFRTGSHQPPALWIGICGGYLFPIIAFSKTMSHNTTHLNNSQVYFEKILKKFGTKYWKNWKIL